MISNLYSNASIYFSKVICFIFPISCLICGKESKEYLCAKCERDLAKKASLKIDIYTKVRKVEIINRSNTINGNLDNNEVKYYFNKHIYLFKYEGLIRNKIIDYKFNDKAYLCELFVKIILKNKKLYSFLKSYDIILPVPIHKKRKAERGYNQSELIAGKIADRVTNIQLDKNSLIKEKNNITQSSLSREDRNLNVKNVYKIINKEKIKNKNIIIFDDIYTTGNTVNECAKVLKENGANKILVFTIAKD